MRSTLRPTGTPYRMSVATASAVFRVRLTERFRVRCRAPPRPWRKRSRRCLFQQFQSSLIPPVLTPLNETIAIDIIHLRSPCCFCASLPSGREGGGPKCRNTSFPTSPASLAVSWPIADQSSVSPPWASNVRNRSRSRLASGMGTRRSSGRERQADVFVAQWCCKTGGVDFSVDDQPAISFVHRGGEQRRGQNVEIFALVDAALADKRHGLAERFDDRSDQ